MPHSSHLLDLISRHTVQDGIFQTAIEGVKLIRWSTPSQPMPLVYEPTACLVAQGRKQASIGAAHYVYDRERYLIASVAQPVMGSILEASEAEPYLCLQIDLDICEIAEIATRLPAEAGSKQPTSGLALGETSAELLDAARRLLALLDTPQDIPALAPLIRREIHYRLLTGPGGLILRQMAHADSRLNQIAQAIVWIRQSFRDACRIEQAAQIAGMSRSSFHQHFRTVTSLTPLEFRLQLRLQEARRLMLAEGIDAASAGFEVGYNSPSQFNRDYGRLFGSPPAKDIAQLRASGAAEYLQSSALRGR